MSAIGGLLGLNGGFNGTGAAAPSGYQTVAGTNTQQINDAYFGNQNALQSQQQLLQALQGQGGLGNQSQVYNQLQGVVNGTGPNPAQAQLAQATGANVANQAALMAGQRGAGSNVGLLARQAAQQGANTQQQAAGQAATLQAQQSLNALGQAGNIANTQAQNQIGATGALTQAQQGEQNILQNALAQNNAQNVQMQGNINTANAGLAGQQMQGQQGLIGGVLGAGGSAIGLADGGDVPDDGPQSSLGQYFSQMGSGQGGPNALQSGMQDFATGIGQRVGSWLAPSAAPLSVGMDVAQQAPGSGIGINAAKPLGANPMGDSGMAKGGNVGSKLKAGGKVSGKAPVPGNSPKNDNVKALLSPGEGVIDRETMQHPGQVGDAARFVMAYVNSKKGKK